MINNLGPDLKFIFEKTSKSLNFLDIDIRIVEINLVLDIHYKPTNSFNYLTYTSCHPPHTKLSLPTAKFERLSIPKQIKQVGLFPCANCIFYKNVFFKECLSFSSKSKNKLLTWHYRRFLVVTVFICMCLFAVTVTFSILGKLKN